MYFLNAFVSWISPVLSSVFVAAFWDFGFGFSAFKACFFHSNYLLTAGLWSGPPCLTTTMRSVMNNIFSNIQLSAPFSANLFSNVMMGAHFFQTAHTLSLNEQELDG